MPQLAHLTSSYRAHLIANTYKQWFKPKKRVLDIGCGNGVVSFVLQKKMDINLTGCDIIHYVSEPISFVKMYTEEKLPFKDNAFDIAMFNDVLHHMPKETQKKLLIEALRIAPVVLIFEVQPTIRGKLFDYILNKIHHFHMKIPFTFQTATQWELLFGNLPVTYQTQYVPTPLLYPFTHIAFQLKRQ